MIWELPSGAPMWGLDGLSPVRYVRPGSPAQRAGLKRGDRVLRIDGEAVGRSPRVPTRGYRPGQRVILTVASAGGTRKVEITLEPTPKPFGMPPVHSEFVGDELLVSRNGETVCVEMGTGKVRWRADGDLVASGSGLVLKRAGDTLRATDAATGRERWHYRSLWYSRCFVTEKGFLIIETTRDGTEFQLLNPKDGRPRWTIGSFGTRPTTESDGGEPVHIFPDRLLLRTAVGKYSPRMMGGLSPHSGPTCLRYALVDLESGNLLWHRATGGRRHPGSTGKFTVAYIPFDPYLKGTVTSTEDSIVWYDLDKKEVCIIDPTSAREKGRASVPGATHWSAVSPPGHVGLRAGDELVWVNTSTFEVTSLPDEFAMIEHNPSSSSFGLSTWGAAAFDAGRAYVNVTGQGFKSSKLIGYELDQSKPRKKWEVALQRADGEVFYDQFGRRPLVPSGRYLLARSKHHATDVDTYRWIDAATGEVMWKHEVDNPSIRRGGGGRLIGGPLIQQPYLVIESSSGLAVFKGSR